MKKKNNYFKKFFCFSSLIFLTTCCFWYGGRFIYFYLDQHKTEKENAKNISHIIITENKLKESKGNHYFFGNKVNNYLKYSNITWRIIKVTNDNSVYLITDNPISYLNNGNNNYINMWLNKNETENTGILEQNLNNLNEYLLKYNVCNDKVNELNNITCNNIDENNFIGLLSIQDYLNTGGNESFINNGKYIFLNNTNDNNNLWYINNEGKLGISEQEDIYGIKPVIRLNGNTKLISGNGKENSPYIIEETPSLFGSYVKLGDDLWRIYNIENENIKLISTNYITQNNENLKIKYSNTNYSHNDTITTSLAYYLNNDYLNSLPYKDIIIENSWNNYFYGTENNYNYTEIFNNKINTKVSLISIGDIIFNDNNLNSFYTNTGTNNTNNLIYTINNNGTLSKNRVNYPNYVVPSISINKNILTKGNGSIESPYEME